MFDADPLLRRLERTALVFCLAAAGLALVVRRGHPDVALGVLGGGFLTAISYWAIRSSVSGLLALVERGAGASEEHTPEAQEDVAAREPPAGEEASEAPGLVDSRLKPAAILVRLVVRYALLGLVAYAMIARLRLHPVGLLIGVSSLFVAASIEAVRGRAGMGRHRPRA